MIKNDDFIKYIKRWLISHYSEFNYKPYFVRDWNDPKLVDTFLFINPLK